MGKDIHFSIQSIPHAPQEYFLVEACYTSLSLNIQVCKDDRSVFVYSVPKMAWKLYPSSIITSLEDLS